MPEPKEPNQKKVPSLVYDLLVVAASFFAVLCMITLILCLLYFIVYLWVEIGRI